MALVLGLSDGDDFFVGDERVTLESVIEPVAFTLKVRGDEFLITDRKSVEVLPDVMISAGTPGRSCVVKVVIDAPRSVPIWRGNIYREKQRDARGQVAYG